MFIGVRVGAVVGVRAALDRRAYVSALRLDTAFATFRPGDPGQAASYDPLNFTADHDPRTNPAACLPLTVLTSRVPLDARSWTGTVDSPAKPVILLTVRLADAGSARAELERKRVAMLRCTVLAVTPSEGAPISYTVTGRHWQSSAVGTTVRWSLVGGAARYDFYVRRYANTLTWTYTDDASNPMVRDAVADSLVARLRYLSHR